MEANALAIQLSQIESIQSELRRLLLEDEPDGLSELLAEKRARLEAVLAERETEEFGARPVYARLLRILRTDHELQALVNQQLTILGTELRKTSEAQRLTRAYIAKPAVAAVATGRLLSDVSV